MSNGFSKNGRLVQLSRAATGIVILAVGLCGLACEAVNTLPDNRSESAGQLNERREPVIEAAPIAKTDDQWQVITNDTITLTVTAPDAQSVKILYRPAFTEERHVELKQLISPSAASGTFSTQLKVPADFAGDVWAEVNYANGEKKETKPIALTLQALPTSEPAGATYKHTEESARSDALTGGTIEKTTLQVGQPDIRITVNIPAFQLTLWQNGKEVKTYSVGIGRKEFPLPSGLRHATQIVFNPDWVPPDSAWVEAHDVAPGERVEADDPRNPLGKIKIPLGNGILIHQASRASDLGHLVSHGCVRMLTPDLFDLSEKIIEGRKLPVSKQQIEHAKTSKDRLVVKLDAPLMVDINYDTQVVEGGVLHLYPDVYNRNVNTIQKVRAELESVRVDPANVDDNTLAQILNRVTSSQEFAVSVADIRLGRALIAGRNQPLTPELAKKAVAARPRAGENRKRRP